VNRLVVPALLLSLATSPAGASNAVSLGYSDETTIVEPGTDACASGTLIYNHDGSFENGYAWQYGGEAEPYYGAFGEGYDLGAGTIACGSFWVSTLPGWGWYVSDCYVWEGGTSASPGAVLGVVTGTVFENVPNWPTVGRNDVDMNISVDGPFTIGYWGDWPGSLCDYFCAADENGPRGHPWTCIAPGMGYPSGWQDPAIVGGYWGPTKSMGCGVYFEQATPVEGESWGEVKALFR
jgi:hypothetical protein